MNNENHLLFQIANNKISASIGALMGCLGVLQHPKAAWGCCSTPKLSEKLEIFRLSEILGCRSKNVLIIFSVTPSSVKQCLPV